MVRKIFLIILNLILVFSSSLGFGETRMKLSLSECLTVGLANNLDIKIAKLESLIEGEDVDLARSIFDTIVDGKISYENDERAKASTIYGTKSLTANYELGVSKKTPLGTEIDIDYSNQREWTNSSFAVNNPLHDSELSLTVNQPIFKNFFGYVDRRSVKLSEIEAEIAGIKSLDKIEDSVAEIEKAYWNLAFAEQNMGLKKRFLKQAEKLYQIFERHLKTGLRELTEVFEAEANMKIRKTEYNIAENELMTAMNTLKLLLNQGEDFLISPRDRLGSLGEEVDLIGSLRGAFLTNREYKMKKKNLDAKNVTLKMKENSLWPEIDLVGTLAINGVDKKFEKANRRLTTNKYTMYYGGIEVSFPLENNRSRSEYNKAKLEKEKAILELLQAEKKLLTEIDEKVRNVNINLENSKHWTKIKKIQYEKFKAEEKKLKYGRSDSKTLIDYQNDLALAALNEYRAVLDYYSALIDLENAKDSLLSKAGVLEP